MSVTVPAPVAGAARSSTRVTAVWLCGVVALLPIGLLPLPLNLTPVDLWIVVGLPVICLSLLARPWLPGGNYLLPLWLILVASLVSTFTAPSPGGALLVVVKELFLFAWFLALIIVLSRVNETTWRLTINFWMWVAVGHGLLILAQFAVPEFWRLFVDIAGKSQEFSVYRPSGLSENANWAAYYQLLGFVPFVLSRPKAATATVAGSVLFCSMLATGSMAAILAFAASTLVAVAALALAGRARALLDVSMRFLLAAGLLGSALILVVRADEGYRSRLESIVIGRADRSSAGRIDLWLGGVEVLMERQVLAWGIGPENFRHVAPQAKQLHNDALAFAVERGIVGLLGLAALFAVALLRSMVLVVRVARWPTRVSPAHVVFVAALVAAFIESLTHQVFHFRAMWLVLALQEAALLRTASGRELQETASPPACGHSLRELRVG